MKFQSNMLWTGLVTATGLRAALAFPSFLAERSSGASDAKLYAYGTNISGLPILYSVANGKQFILPSGPHMILDTWLTGHLVSQADYTLRRATQLPRMSSRSLGTSRP